MLVLGIFRSTRVLVPEVVCSVSDKFNFFFLFLCSFCASGSEIDW